MKFLLTCTIVFSGSFQPVTLRAICVRSCAVPFHAQHKAVTNKYDLKAHKISSIPCHFPSSYTFAGSARDFRWLPTISIPSIYLSVYISC